MPNLTSRSVLRRLVVAFAIAIVPLSAGLIAVYGRRQIPRLGDHATAATIAQVLLLSIPFIAAMTIPIAVFVAVLWTFVQLGKEGGIDSTRRGLRAQLVPVAAFAIGVSALMLVWNAELLPRANAKLVEVTTGVASARSDRSMTIQELRVAAEQARARAASAMQVARYEIELQKKFSLAAASLALALVAAAIGLRFPRGGTGLVAVMSVVVFAAYYALVVSGETLANRLVVSPVIAMWTPDVLLVIAGFVLLWRSGSGGQTVGANALAATSNARRDPENDSTHLAFAPR